MMTPQEKIDGLRKRSGSVDVDSRLVSFLYQLMRDHLPAGVVEKLVWDCEVSGSKFTNGYLANYAVDVARRLGDNPQVRDDVGLVQCGGCKESLPREKVCCNGDEFFCSSCCPDCKTAKDNSNG